ncbi:GNAT domain-containing protein [Xylariomycetidae sp. FL0641]|nr:GNAT domain-containing protein [Xylariomycetidae sp. FL0641]
MAANSENSVLQIQTRLPEIGDMLPVLDSNTFQCRRLSSSQAVKDVKASLGWHNDEPMDHIPARERIDELSSSPDSAVYGVYQKDYETKAQSKQPLGLGGVTIFADGWPIIWCSFPEKSMLIQHYYKTLPKNFLSVLRRAWFDLTGKKASISPISVPLFSIPLYPSGVQKLRDLDLLCVEIGEDDEKHREHVAGIYQPCGRLPNGNELWREKDLTDEVYTTMPDPGSLPAHFTTEKEKLYCYRLTPEQLRPPEEPNSGENKVLAGLHELRKEEEAMKLLHWNEGSHDSDQDQTIKEMTPDEDEAIFVIEKDQEVIGYGRITWREYSWWHLSYVFRKKSEGKGRGTEFVKELIQVWKNLPRKPEKVRVDAPIQTADWPEEQKEYICAQVRADNIVSRAILDTAGFEKKKEYTTQVRERKGNGDRHLVTKEVYLAAYSKSGSRKERLLTEKELAEKEEQTRKRNERLERERK